MSNDEVERLANEPFSYPLHDESTCRHSVYCDGRVCEMFRSTGVYCLNDSCDIKDGVRSMPEKPKTTGGVWVPCSERLPEEMHADELGVIFVKTSNNKSGRLYWKNIKQDCPYNYTHWLDTTQPVMTVAEHETILQEVLEKTKQSKLTASVNNLVDALTNMIDKAVRKQSFSTYDEWQNAVEIVVKKHCDLKGKCDD